MNRNLMGKIIQGRRSFDLHVVDSRETTVLQVLLRQKLDIDLRAYESQHVSHINGSN